MNSLVATIGLLGAAQGAFLGIALLFSRFGNRQANRYLAGYVLVFTVALLDFYLDGVGILARHAWLEALLWPREFFYGVFIYLYCRELTLPGVPQSRRLRGILWLPAMLHVSMSWSLLFLSDSLQRSIMGSGEGLDAPWSVWHWLLDDVEALLAIVHFSVLMVLGIRLLNDHRRRITDQFSYTENINLDWLRYMVIGTLVVYLIWVPGELLLLAMPSIEWNRWHTLVLHLSMVLLIYTLGWVGLRQPDIFARHHKAAVPRSDNENVSDASEDSSPAEDMSVASENPLPASDAAESGEKYSRSALSPELAQALIDETQSLMDQDQLYLDSRLSLASLAERLKVSTNYLSQAINQRTEQNFFDFVNSYRIRHSMKLLGEQKKSVIDVAMDSGFNSKSAFYAAFKKHQSMTPGQYRRSIQ